MATLEDPVDGEFRTVVVHQPALDLKAAFSTPRVFPLLYPARDRLALVDGRLTVLSTARS